MAFVGNYPRRFGKYLLVAPLARGGMGELHLAVSGSSGLRKLCVIKQLLHHLSDRESAARFLDEARVMVKLSHGNLVPVFESGVVDGQHYLVMEYIEGRDLRDVWNTLIAQGRRCPINVATHLIKEVCRGLGYVHTYRDLQLVHRDVSPPNVLLSYSGEVRLADFGLAYSRIKVQRTAPGVLFGKLSYMSPEQARKQRVDARADIYSAGIILWELITGKRLFAQDGSLLDQLQRAVEPHVPPPLQVDPTLPPALDLITLRALAPDPAARFPDAETMRGKLAALVATIDPTTDSSHVQSLLRDLYGHQIDAEQQALSELLERTTGLVELNGQRPQDDDEPSTSDGWPRELEVLGERPLGEDDPSATLKLGTVIGERYRIEGPIGEGGMGTVYRATHLGIDRQVAVKVLHPVCSWMPELVARFQHEAKAASRIGHPNIVEVFDAGTTEDGCLYFAMEFLQGQDLADVLAAEGPLGTDRALDIAIQTSQALSAAHAAGIVHRDLKPENIFLVSRGAKADFVKVLDFGVAMSRQMDGRPSDQLTVPGVAMGTPAYMAPEQASGEGCDHRADIYALGIMLYEMLVGRCPHSGENTLQVFNRKLTEAYEPISQHRTDIPSGIEQLIERVLASDPQQRPQSMGELCYDLTKVTQGRAGAVASLLGLQLADPSDRSAAVGGTSPSNADAMPQQQPSGHAADSEPTIADETMPTTASAVPLPLDAVVHTATLPTARRGFTEQRTRRVGAALALLLLLPLLGVAIWSQIRRQEREAQQTAALQRSQHARRQPEAAQTTTSELQPRHTPPRDSAQHARQPSATGAAPGGEIQIEAPSMLQATQAAHRTERSTASRTLLRRANEDLSEGRFVSARIAFQRVRQNTALRGEALVGLAHVEFQLGNLHAAEAFATVAAREGGGAAANLTLGNIYFRLQKFQQAIDRYRRVLAESPQHPEARRNLLVAEHRLQAASHGRR